MKNFISFQSLVGTMVNTIIACVGLGLAMAVVVAGFGMENMVAKGKWSVLNIARCENHEDYDYDFDVKRTKLNRTHDGFNAVLKLAQAVTEDFAIRVDVCKFVDGGCKDYQVLADDSFCGFIKKYAEDNLISVLTMVGVDPPGCPIPEGEYELKDYIFNYDELPEDGLPGKYTAVAYLIDEGNEIACVSMTVEFIEKDDDDE